MNKFHLFTLWGGLFILCACLGFIPEPQGVLSVVMTALGILFFAPPGLLVYRSVREKDTPTLQLIRNLSALSLGLTLLLLLGNFLSVLGSEALGNVLYALLVVVSCPMVCTRYWVVSLFGWACLLMVCLTALKKKK